MKSKSHPLIAGTLILTLTGLASRIIGFFYKIFLSRTIGAEGIGIYQMIFPIYGVCYALTISGIEIAISRFVSQETARNNHQKARSILWVGLCLSLSCSLLISLLLYGNAGRIAEYLLHEIRCTVLLQIMSLVIPFSACHSCIAGYYYGLKKTGIPACTQLFEQLSRVISVYLIYRISLEKGALLSPAAAVIGLVIGEFISTLFTLFTVLDRPVKAKSESAPPYSRKNIAKHMLRLCAPVTGNRVCINLLSSAEAMLIPFTLQQYGLPTERALGVYGTLTGMAMPFIFFPSVLTNAVSVLLLPSVSEAQASQDEHRLHTTVRKTIGYCLPLGFICTLFFLFTGKFLGNYFFQNSMAGDFIITLAWICPFLYLNSTLHSIINGLGKTGIGFFNNLIGILIRIFFILAFVPHFGIQGYLWGILANQLFVALLNLQALRRYLT